MTVRPAAVRASAAVFGALAVHVLLALALAVCFDFVPQRDGLATLELASLELSFAETVDESAPAVPNLSSSASAHRPPKPKVVEPPPADVVTPLPPAPGERALREPKEDARIEAAEARNESPDARSSAAPRQALIDAPPRLRRRIRPDYPNGARRRGEQGEVLVELDVNADGGVDSVRVVRSSGFAELDRAAVQAARTARFEPARSGESSVASTVRLPLSFRLR